MAWGRARKELILNRETKNWYENSCRILIHGDKCRCFDENPFINTSNGKSVKIKCEDQPALFEWKFTIFYLPYISIVELHYYADKISMNRS